MSFEKFKNIDYEYSKKLSKILPMNSKFRIFLQLITQTGTFIAWGIVLLLVFFAWPQYRPEVLSISIVTLIMIIPIVFLKQTVRRNRPDFKDDRMGTVSFDKFSFPSGHATRASYAVVMMNVFFPTFIIWWIIWSIVMIFSRLLLGVHYISDIIVGIIIGTAGMLIIVTLNWLPITPFVLKYLGFLL